MDEVDIYLHRNEMAALEDTITSQAVERHNEFLQRWPLKISRKQSPLSRTLQFLRKLAEGK